MHLRAIQFQSSALIYFLYGFLLFLNCFWDKRIGPCVYTALHYCLDLTPITLARSDTYMACLTIVFTNRVTLSYIQIHHSEFWERNCISLVALISLAWWCINRYLFYQGNKDNTWPNRNMYLFYFYYLMDIRHWMAILPFYIHGGNHTKLKKICAIYLSIFLSWHCFHLFICTINAYLLSNKFPLQIVSGLLPAYYIPNYYINVLWLSPLFRCSLLHSSWVLG